LLAFYNGGDGVQTFETAVSSPAPCLLYGTPALTVSQGVLHLEIPPRSLVVLADKDGRGFVKDGILYREPIKGGMVQCEEDAFAAQYTTSGGVPELAHLYINGDTLLDGEGEVRFFRWENMRPQE